jgi:hypothetical protein
MLSRQAENKLMVVAFEASKGSSGGASKNLVHKLLIGRGRI